MFISWLFPLYDTKGEGRFPNIFLLIYAMVKVNKTNRVNNVTSEIKMYYFGLVVYRMLPVFLYSYSLCESKQFAAFSHKV